MKHREDMMRVVGIRDTRRDWLTRELREAGFGVHDLAPTWLSDYPNRSSDATAVDELLVHATDLLGDVQITAQVPVVSVDEVDSALARVLNSGLVSGSIVLYSGGEISATASDRVRIVPQQIGYSRAGAPKEFIHFLRTLEFCATGATDDVVRSSVTALMILCQGYLASYASQEGWEQLLGAEQARVNVREALTAMGWFAVLRADPPLIDVRNCAKQFSRAASAGWWRDVLPNGEALGAAARYTDVEDLLVAVREDDIRPDIVARAYLSLSRG